MANSRIMILILLSSLFMSSCWWIASVIGRNTSGLVIQNVTVNWKGFNYSRDYICAPTVFPEVRSGGGDIFSGGTGATHIRRKKNGMSPVPQWMAMQVDEDELLIKLACDDQWLDRKHIVADASRSAPLTITPEIASRVYLAKREDSYTGLIPISAPDIKITGPVAIENLEDQLSATRQQIDALRPFSDYLRAFPKRGLADPILYRVTERLPDTNESGTEFFSKPWFFTCDGEVSFSASEWVSEVYTPPGQNVFNATPALNECQFARFFNNNSNGDPGSKSPYRQGIKATTPLHIQNDSGESVFFSAHRILLRDPELMLHIPKNGGTQGHVRDKFLDSDVYQNSIKPAIDAFEDHN